jgi:hypothetical protein
VASLERPFRKRNKYEMNVHEQFIVHSRKVIIIIIIISFCLRLHGTDWSGSQQEQMASSCVHDSQSSGSVTCSEFLE